LKLHDLCIDPDLGVADYSILAIKALRRDDEWVVIHNNKNSEELTSHEGIRVLEVPGRIPAIVSGGKSRRNHAPTKLVIFYPLFPERHLQRLVFFTINKMQGQILIFSKWLHKGGQWK